MLDEATQRLMTTVAGLDDAAVAAPSGLPDWSRGHVLTHIARNAEGMRNLLADARTGSEFGMYASTEARSADIAAGAGRPIGVHEADLRVSAGRFAAEVKALPAEAWSASVRPFPWVTGYDPIPVAAIPLYPTSELEIHHVDLDAGYSFADCPADLAGLLVNRMHGRHESSILAAVTATDIDHTWTFGAASTDAADTGTVPTVTGTAAAVLGWLTQRTAGEDLVVEGGMLPEVSAL